MPSVHGLAAEQPSLPDHALERGSLARVGPEKGRFRTFLLKSLSYFLADAADHQNTLRRGGGSRLIQLDALEAEDR